MDSERFKNSPIGRLVPISGYDARFNEQYEHVAFVADPLPNRIDLEASTWKAVADAMLALGRLDNATSRFPSPTLLVRPALGREAVSTSALEGTFTDLEDVLAADVEEIEGLSPDLREVVNAIAAMEFGFDAVKAGRPLSVHLACEVQEVLIRGTRTEDPDRGRVRTGNVFIGREDQRVPETRFVPSPSGPLLDEGFRAWETWVNADNEIHLLVKVALAHYQFEALHPFHDGNGRVGRTIAILQLIAGGALHFPNLAISVALEEHDTEYRDSLAAVSETGDFDPWVRLLTGAIADQSNRELEKVDRLLALRTELVDQARRNRIRGLGVQIAEDLIGFPFLRVPAVSQRYEVSFEAANKAVARLVDAGILTQVGERTYGRVFVANSVIAALRNT